MKIYVRDLKEYEVVNSSFLVQNKELRHKKTGDPFLSLTIADKSGDIDAKMWDNVRDVAETFGVGDFVHVKGVMSLFNGRPQFTVHSLKRLDEREIQLSDYFATSARDPEEMFAELMGVVEGIGNTHLKELLRAFFVDESICRRYKRAPAAKQIHHAYFGGLIEHVLSLCTLAKMVGPHYPIVDLDLLLTGIILHDIGKIDELVYERSLGYSDVGQLIGHISIATRYLHDKLREVPGFPPALAVLVEHMILSHHGKLEFGSPKTPSFPEAILLSYLDDLDSKMECVRAQLERDEKSDGTFTAYNYAMERSFLKKDLFLSGLPAEPEKTNPIDTAVRSPQRFSPAPGAASTRVSDEKARAKSPSSVARSLFGDKLSDALKSDS
ncbi:MAG: HD domain-containing protein [Bryobacterales bacterium]|nr:HD domain-containing protein [Bryobacterales bacterium]